MRSWIFFTALLPLLNATAAEVGEPLKFSFGSQAVPGFQQVTADNIDDGVRSFGFLAGGQPTEAPGINGVASTQPIRFFTLLPEGNYRVKVTQKGTSATEPMTIKVESRRLMIEKSEVDSAGNSVSEFTVNVRQPQLPGGGNVSLNSREVGPPAMPRWDDRLSFEFNGKHPTLSELEILPAPQTLTVFIAGDSTVADQNQEPWAGWAQMLPAFFGTDVAVSNHAESGLALYSFKRQKRLEKILSMMKPGDYVFVQFGHNDQKDKSENAGPFTSYKTNLKDYVALVKEKGGVPILVTPMERRRWNGGELGATLTEYAEAVRQVGAEDQVPVIDLNAMSLKLYGALGPEASKKAFVHYPANTYPGQEKVLKDDTHHNAFGAYELAKCVAEGIKEKIPSLAAKFRPGLPAFDPAHPDDPAKFAIPASPVTELEKPAGS